MKSLVGTVKSATGFNPCSSGYLPESLWRKRPHVDAQQFQSLFFWIPPGKMGFSVFFPQIISVSILVLLDTSRKGGRLLFARDGNSGFNPCSSGYLPESGASGVARRPDVVSILVLLDTSRKAAAPDPGPAIDRGFNPCSSGYLPERRLQEVGLVAVMSFNPCSSGYLPEREGLGAILRVVGGFQSLFFWIPPGKCTWEWRWGGWRGFQSLFFWIPPGKFIRLRLRIGIRRFQSLFFWIPPGKLLVSGFDVRVAGFQSLFFWIPPGKTGHCQWIQPDKTGFNPCSSGYLPERAADERFTATDPGFQSLFFWIPPGKCNGAGCGSC